jgi:hypothetical protein
VLKVTQTAQVLAAVCPLLVDVGVEVGHLEDLGVESRKTENGFSELRWGGMD